MNLISSIILAVFLIGICYAVDEPNCNSGPPGLYCLNDLGGYLDCRVKHGQFVNEKVFCNAGTRCKCFLRNACPDDSPCATYRAPSPWPQSYTLGYHGEAKSTNPQGTTTIAIQGLWRRNDITKKSLKWNWVGAEWNFELIVPNSEGSYDKFTGNYPATCKKTTISQLPKFDISKFTYTGAAYVAQRQTERWEFLVGARHLGESSTRTTWYSAYDESIQSHRPTRFVEKVVGGASVKSNTETDWTVGLFTTNSGGGDHWFRVPDFC